jgi:hypothetical protein
MRGRLNAYESAELAQLGLPAGAISGWWRGRSGGRHHGEAFSCQVAIKVVSSVAHGLQVPADSLQQLHLIWVLQGAPHAWLPCKYVHA